MWKIVAPQGVWQQQLQAAVAASGWSAIAPPPSRRQVDSQALRYRSAIALPLAAQTGQSAAAIAARLAASCPPAEFAVAATASGYLVATWQAAAIATWLEALAGAPELTLPPAPAARTANLVPLHYARDRCTSLLQLAAREGWLPGSCQPKGLWHCAAPLPWRATAGLPWTAADWALLDALANVADAQLRPGACWLPVGLELSEAVLTWLRQRPLAALPRSHWGLLVVAQRLLASLLAALLGASSPESEERPS